MTTVLGRDASVMWQSGTVTPVIIPETRNISIDLGGDFAEDTVHGDVNRSYAPTFANFAASITGLWATGTGAQTSSKIVADTLSKVSGRFFIYIGSGDWFFSGSGYVSVDDATSPYDDFATFNWSVRSSGAVGYSAG